MNCLSMAMHSHQRSRENTMMRDRVGRHGSARPNPSCLWTYTAPAVVALSIVLVAGCKGDSPQAGEQPSTTSTPTAAPAPKPEDEAIEAWKTALGATTKDPAAVAAAEKVADAEALKAFEAFLEKPTRATSNARALAASDGAVEIQDCVLVDPATSSRDGALGYRASAREVNGSWRIVRAQLFGNDVGDGFKVACVPRAMNDAVVAGYENYWLEAPKFWSSPDPSNPAVSKVTTGANLAHTKSLLRDFQSRNAVLRNNPAATHPEVIQVISPTEVVVRDCQQPDPEYGLYDRASGRRLPDAAAAPPNKQTVVEVHMVLDDGTWKFAELASANTTCQIAPSERGVSIL
jgi:hypothetical protein